MIDFVVVVGLCVCVCMCVVIVYVLGEELCGRMCMCFTSNSNVWLV